MHELAIKWVEIFFEHCIASCKKHFSKWVDDATLLSHAVASSNPELMTTVSKWVIDNEQPAEGASFSSETHGNVRVDLAEFMNQVSKNVD